MHTNSTHRHPKMSTPLIFGKNFFQNLKIGRDRQASDFYICEIFKSQNF